MTWFHTRTQNLTAIPRTRTILATWILCCSSVSLVLAADLGPNRGGTLVLHSNPQLIYTDGTDYCGSSGLDDCEDTNERADTDGTVVLYAIAAFDAGASPRLAGVTFGVEFDPTIGIVDWSHCAEFEISTGNWPAPGSGTAVTWGEAQTVPLVEVYWFAAYAYGGSGNVRLIEHPTHGANFGDDSIPAVLDPVAALGEFGFFIEGYAPCPEPFVPSGACCIEGDPCAVLTEEDCLFQSGSFSGDGTDCEPDPCAIRGACCLDDGRCFFAFESECESGGGTFLLGDDCDPNPCEQPSACCFESGACRVLTRSICDQSEGGSYQGDGTTCDPNPCPQPGACCSIHIGCVVTLESICDDVGGTFFPETPCDPDPCPHPDSGACCFPNGACELFTEEDCAGQGGIFQGENVACTPELCPEIRGACCIEGECVFVNRQECESQGGIYWGDDVACEEGDCLMPGCALHVVNATPNGVTAAPGSGARSPSAGTCGSLGLNADGSYEDGYAWDAPCVIPPDYGAFAERYSVYEDVYVCAVVLDLTQIGQYDGQTMDVYIWEDSGGLPGSVVSMDSGVDPGLIASWPSVSRHTISTDACPDGPAFFVGYWALWDQGSPGWYVGADLDGPGGGAITKVAPGVGFPAGWHQVGDVFGSTQAIGIGIEFFPGCGGTPVEESTWGQIKHRFYETPERNE